MKWVILFNQLQPCCPSQVGAELEYFVLCLMLSCVAGKPYMFVHRPLETANMEYIKKHCSPLHVHWLHWSTADVTSFGHSSSFQPRRGKAISWQICLLPYCRLEYRMQCIIMWVGVGLYTSITQYLNTYWLSPSILLFSRRMLCILFSIQIRWFAL